jgi:hypothetical protein
MGIVMFLTAAELAELTGYKQATKQVAMLRRQGIAFFTNAAGHPKVARAVIEGRNQPEVKPKSWTPSWADNRA